MTTRHTTSQDTREALVDAAVELFAENGFEGVGTRAIAEHAGVNIGGIHYHFGSKEALYVEAFRVALRAKQGHPVQRAIFAHPGDMATPEGQARVVRRAVACLFEDLSDPSEEALRFRRLLLRELASPSSAMPLLVEQVFAPSHEEFKSLCLMIRPDMSDAEAHAWGFMPAGQWVFYAQAGGPVSMLLGQEGLHREMLGAMEAMTARAMIALLGLPLPEDIEGEARAARETNGTQGEER